MLRMSRLNGEHYLAEQPSKHRQSLDSKEPSCPAQLIETQQVARMLGMSTVHVRRLARIGRIPPGRKIGLRKLCWRLIDIEALINAEPDFKPNSK